MRRKPKSLRPIGLAPKDGSVIDLWSPVFGWVRDVWWDDEGPVEGDGWVTICPRPFTGWRKIGAA